MPVVVDLLGTPGTGLEHTALWINRASDLSDVRSFTKVGGPLSLNTKARVDVRQLANRVRLIRQGSVTGKADLTESAQITLAHLDRDDVTWLRNLTGELVCFRDHIGTKFYGAWSEAPRDVQPQFRDWIDLKLSIDQITYSEDLAG